MEAAFAQITPKQLSRFLQNPALAYEEIIPELSGILPPGIDEVEGFADRLKEALEAQQKSFAGLGPAAAKVRAEFDKIESHMLKQAKGQHTGGVKLFSLQKDWHVLQYVLNGTGEPGPAPIQKSILGGTEFPIPADYGPLRYLTPQEVKEIAEAFAEVDSQNLFGRLNKQDAELKNIYLAHTMDDPEEWGYLPDLFERFRSFYRDAAKNGNAVLLKII